MIGIRVEKEGGAVGGDGDGDGSASEAFMSSDDEDGRKMSSDDEGEVAGKADSEED